MSNTSDPIKATSHRIVDELPDDACWDDLNYRIYVRQSVESGTQDADAGRLYSVEKVRRSIESSTP